MAGWKNRAAGWFIDREFFMRANGQVRFLKLSAQLQRRVAGTVASVVGLWLVVTLGMAINQLSVSAQRMALTEQEAKVESAEERVANYRGYFRDQGLTVEQIFVSGGPTAVMALVSGNIPGGGGVQPMQTLKLSSKFKSLMITS